MNTFPSPIVVALFAGAISCATAVLSADQPTWSVDASTDVASQGFELVPLGDGSAIVLSQIHELGRYAWRLDAEMQLHPLGLVAENLGSLGEVDTPTGPLLIGEHSPWTSFGTCKRLAGAVAGRELRLASARQLDFEFGLPFADAFGRFGRFAEYVGPHDGEQNLRFLQSDHDCTPEWLFDIGDRQIQTLLNLSDGSGALALMRAVWQPGEAERARLVRLDRNGVVWDTRLELEDGSEVFPQRLVRLPGDDVLVTGDSYSPAEGGRTVLQRFDADGQLRWRHEVDESGLPSDAYIAQVLVHDQTVMPTFAYGGFSPPVGGPPNYPTVLVAINAIGKEISRQPLYAPFSRLPQAPQRRHRPVYASYGQLMETTAGGRLEVIGPRDGAMAQMADGRFLHGSTNPPRVWMRDEAGTEQTVELPLPSTRPRVGRLKHGDRFGVVDYSNSSDHLWIFRVFDPDGSLLWTWSRLQAMEIGAGGRAPSVHADETRVCMVMHPGNDAYVACFDRATGVALGPVAHLTEVFNSNPPIQLWLRDNGVWMLRFHEDRILSRRLAGPEGTQAEQPVAGLPAYSTIPSFMPLDSRRLLAVGCGEQCRTRVVDVDGEPVLDLPTPWQTGAVKIHRAPNGFLLSISNYIFSQTNELEMQRVDLTFGPRWQQTLVPPTVPNWAAPSNLLFRNGRWIHWQRKDSSIHMEALDDANGHRVWSQIRRLRGNGYDGCLTPNQDGPVGLVTQRGQRLDVDWLNPGDGAVVGASSFEAVGKIDCQGLPVGNTGAALSAVGIERQTVLRIDPPAQPTETPSIAWLRGVWYDPGSSGQGFMFQHYPEQELMSGAWFTYSSDGEHDRADQRWYTLQAPTESSDSSAIGTIYSSEGGRFGEPPAVSSVAVGSVELRMLSCDSALLSYRFDDPENHGQQGAMRLQRLVADAPECADAPKAAASPSGSYWYDPPTSGQGIYLQTIAGRAFGAWFTFDPDGRADDPTAQHWFTLAGDTPLPDGRLPARIMRTIGGSLDDAATTNAAQVGDAWLRLIDCETTQLDYQFNDPRYAAAFEGLEGTMMLRRIGGCEANISNH